MKENHLEKELRKYMRSTRHFLCCPKSYRRHFSLEMKHDLEQFILENETVRISDIIDYFGTPAELAQTYLDSVPQEKISSYKLKKKTFLILFGSIFLILTIAIVLFLLFKLNEPHELDKVYIHQTTEILEEN